jgi:hypothetical protein
MDINSIQFGPATVPDERIPLLLVGSFLLSFLFIRTSARLARSPKVPWWPGSVVKGELHIHHLVFGIILVLLSGFLEFAFAPPTPWNEILAVLFGIGAGLTIDEFALWLHLRDVYWAKEGRSSVDAFVIVITFAVLSLVAWPFPKGNVGFDVFIIVVGFRLLMSLFAALKGKYIMALAGFFLPGIGEIGAIRLAKPHSPWARWFYKGRKKKLTKAKIRDDRWSRRKDRFFDFIGGKPTPVR